MFRCMNLLLAALLCVTAIGCAKGTAGGPKTVPIAGKITFKGQPLADAEIEFIHDGEVFASYGKTDSQGNFQLVQGAVPGPNKVIIRKLPEGFVNDPAGGMDYGQLEAMAMAARTPAIARKMRDSLVPIEYSDPNATPLKFVAPEDGTSEANFNL